MSIDLSQLDLKPIHQGKIRNIYPYKDHLALVTSDSISAFDIIFGSIPYKGQILNQIAAWWFDQVGDAVPHHFIGSPHPYISIVKKLDIIPIEIVIRAYLSGSTSTSAWHAYQHNNREICGVKLPENMKKNEPFSSPIITPTTKAHQGHHDEPISRDNILTRNIVSEKIWNQIEIFAKKLFTIGQEKAAKQGLILVDTKYEMGIDTDGNLCVGDEIHTPDSSRYWLADSYESALSKGEEPKHLDKEFFRLALVERGFDPQADPKDINPKDWFDETLQKETSEKYFQLYEKITGETCQKNPEINTIEKIRENFSH